MNEVAAAHFGKAHRALRAARLLLREDDAENSISRAYYAALHAARGALVTVGDFPKTHRGTSDRFWVRFVETEQFPKHPASVLRKGQGMREEADYEAFSRFDTMAATDLLRDATSFVNAAEALVQELAEGDEERPK